MDCPFDILVLGAVHQDVGGNVGVHDKGGLGRISDARCLACAYIVKLNGAAAFGHLIEYA